MTAPYLPDEVPIVADLAAPTYSAPKERTPCPGQPRVITGSTWLQESSRPAWYEGSNRSGGYRGYQYGYNYNHYQKQQGLAGERFVLKRMLEILDGCWVIYTNLELFVNEGDIDIALVGPGGVLAIEIKTLSRNLFVMWDDWLFFDSDAPQMYSGQPSAQAKDSAFKLQLYLDHYGLRHITVWPVVIMASDALIQVHESQIPVWCKNELDNELSNLNTYEFYSPDELAKIVEVLSN
jgi:hypothetical protein